MLLLRLPPLVISEATRIGTGCCEVTGIKTVLATTTTGVLVGISGRSKISVTGGRCSAFKIGGVPVGEIVVGDTVTSLQQM